MAHTAYDISFVINFDKPRNAISIKVKTVDAAVTLTLIKMSFPIFCFAMIHFLSAGGAGLKIQVLGLTPSQYLQISSFFTCGIYLCIQVFLAPTGYPYPSSVAPQSRQLTPDSSPALRLCLHVFGYCRPVEGCKALFRACRSSTGIILLIISSFYALDRLYANFGQKDQGFRFMRARHFGLKGPHILQA
jgi:hypothetical protein